MAQRSYTPQLWSGRPTRINANGDRSWVTVTNDGPATVYYHGTRNDVSASVNEGSIASGATERLRGQQWVVTAIAGGLTVIEDPVHRAPPKEADVRKYGAVGDGIHDDTEPVKAALATGRKVILPEGVYLFNELLVGDAYTNIGGEGADVSILRCGSAAAGLRFGPEPSADGLPVQFGRSHDFQLDGNGVGAAGLAVNGKYGTLENVLVQRVDGDGLKVLSQNFLYLNVHVGDVDGSSFVLDHGCGGNTFVGAQGHHSSRYNLEVRQSIDIAGGPGVGVLYEVPSYNYFYGGQFEVSGSPTFGTPGLGCALFTAGDHNRYRDCIFYHDETTGQVILIQLTPHVGMSDVNGRHTFRDCTILGEGGSVIGIDVDAVADGVAGGFNADYVVVLQDDNHFSGTPTAIRWGTSSLLLNQHTRQDGRPSTPNGYTTFLATNGVGARYDEHEWADATLLNGWANLGSGYQDVQYRITPQGQVQVRGYANRPAGSSAAAIFQLPEGYRPAGHRIFPSSQGGSHVEAGVLSDGTVSFPAGSALGCLEFSFEPS